MLHGNVVSTHCFVDMDHAGNLVTCHSQTGILVFVGRAPIILYSKHQNTVKTSTFGSKFVAMHILVEHASPGTPKVLCHMLPLWSDPLSIWDFASIHFLHSIVHGPSLLPSLCTVFIFFLYLEQKIPVLQPGPLSKMTPCTCQPQATWQPTAAPCKVQYCAVLLLPTNTAGSGRDLVHPLNMI